jgi:hypothetical protein
MSRLLLVALVAGVFAIAPAASADVPDCDCTTVTCMVSCPGGDATAGNVCVHTEGCVSPLVGFECLRLRLNMVDPDSICVCEPGCADWPYVYPDGPTDLAGCTTFTPEGHAILALGNDLDNAVVEVCGCADTPVQYRSPDINADCDVGLLDFVVFGSAFGLWPCLAQPTGLQHYTVYTGHCAPCNHPVLADFVVFAAHFGHGCLIAGPGACNP